MRNIETFNKTNFQMRSREGKFYTVSVDYLRVKGIRDEVFAAYMAGGYCFKTKDGGFVELVLWNLN